MAIVQTKIKSRSVLTPGEWDDATLKLIEKLTPQELDAFEYYITTGHPDFISNLVAHEYDEVPVPMEEWLDDPFFLGESSRELFKPLRDDLILVFTSQQYETVLYTGALGTGKSEFASIAILRMLYEASCLRDPAVSYGLASGSKIGFAMLAPNENVARAATFEKIIAKVQKSPYFMEEFAPISRFGIDKAFRGNELSFPKRLSIVCGSSSNSSILGANVMGGFIDELNFFQRDAKGSIKTKANARYGEFSKAGALFDSLRRRIKGRFSSRGKLPGILIGASSKTTKDSLTEKFIREYAAQQDAKVFVRDYSIVDTRPSSFSGKTFKVVVGNEIYSSKIIEDYEVENYDSEAIIIDVPEELRSDFDRDISMALRDFMGISTTAIHSFITKVEMLNKIKDETRTHPFSCPLMGDPHQWDSRAPYTIKWNELCRRKDDEWEPRINPWAKRFVSLDPSLTGDGFGFCMSHIAGLIPVKKSDEQGDTTEYLPYFIVDFVLRIKGEPGEEIIFRNVRRLIYEFSAHGFHISNIFTDRFQSRDMCQQLEANGYKAEVLSVDESKDPYLNLRRVIYDGRLKCYNYEILWDELRRLEESVTKVDHPLTGSKDIADALCSCIFALTENATYSEPILPVKGDFLEKDKVDSAENKDENWNEVTVNDKNIAIVPAVQVYRKNTPKTIGPQYNKVTTSGEVLNMRQIEEKSSYILDMIEIG